MQNDVYHAMVEVESTPGLELKESSLFPLQGSLCGFITKNGEFISFSERRDGKGPTQAEGEGNDMEYSRTKDVLSRSAKLPICFC